MCQHNQQVVEAAARIAIGGLKRMVEAAATSEPEKTYFMSLAVAVEFAASHRSHEEALFVCMAASAILDDIAGELMPALRDAMRARCEASPASIVAVAAPLSPSSQSTITPSVN